MGQGEAGRPGSMGRIGHTTNLARCCLGRSDRMSWPDRDVRASSRRSEASTGVGGQTGRPRLMIILPTADVCRAFPPGRLHSVNGSIRTVIGAAPINSGTSPRVHRARSRDSVATTGTTGRIPRAAVCPCRHAERQPGAPGQRRGWSARAQHSPGAGALLPGSWRSVMVTQLDTRRQCRCESA